MQEMENNKPASTCGAEHMDKQGEGLVGGSRRGREPSEHTLLPYIDLPEISREWRNYVRSLRYNKQRLFFLKYRYA